MPYVGGKIASLFREEPTNVALRKMAEVGGDRVHELVIENTPIGGRYEGSGQGGNLRTSWYREPVNKKNDGVFVVYRTKIATDVDYAPHVEYGTGLWGPEHSTYVITPKPPHKFLRWIDPKTGQEVFARRVVHPGSPGAHMMLAAVEKTDAELHAGLLDGVLAEWKRAQERLAD